MRVACGLGAVYNYICFAEYRACILLTSFHFAIPGSVQQVPILSLPPHHPPSTFHQLPSEFATCARPKALSKVMHHVLYSKKIDSKPAETKSAMRSTLHPLGDQRDGRRSGSMNAAAYQAYGGQTDYSYRTANGQYQQPFYNAVGQGFYGYGTASGHSYHPWAHHGNPYGAQPLAGDNGRGVTGQHQQTGHYGAGASSDYGQ